MGCANSAEQSKPDPRPSNRGSTSTAVIQTSKPIPPMPASPRTRALPITLHYFDLYGRGEIFRMIFAFLEQRYEDHRVQFSDWPTLKTSSLCEFGQLPVMEIHNHTLTQTRAILRYVCQVNGLYPPQTSHMDIYLVESICDEIDDLRTPLLELTFKKDSESLVKRYQVEIANMLPAIEERLMENAGNSGFFVGDDVTMADFSVFEFLWDYFLMDGKRQLHESSLANHPKLLAFADRMKRLTPVFQSYILERPYKWL